MITIKEVQGRKALREFIRFPLTLYKDSPHFVPDLISSERDMLSGKKNASMAHCSLKCFLAYKNGKLCGRIAGIINHKANQLWGKNCIRFSRVDFIDDEEVSRALFSAVAAWGKENGCTEIHGPLGFSDMDKEGMLIEGFERDSTFVTIYNHEYYPRHLERLGFAKDVDWVEFLVKIPPEPIEKLDRLSQVVQKRFKLRTLKFKKSRLIIPYIKSIFVLLNETYSDLYQVVPLSAKEIDELVEQYLPFISEQFTCVVLNEKDEVIGFSVAVPSLSSAIKKSSGSMLPFGLLRILKALKKNDTLVLLLVAIRKDYQGLGVNAIFMSHFYKSAREMGIRVAESSPELETNDKVQAMWKQFDVEQHKRRRCFIKPIE